MDLDGFTTDPNEDITLAVGIKEGWTMPYYSLVITDIYLCFGVNKQEEFNQKLIEESC
ncbi:hypothetical protein QH639_19230 [Lysinibacillus sp. 1 U-2021]|uniref:hypothetical protein n=1 Tax=Lysinibacillus sp. 1 U-2021 TaxID=3039426 RepID=UPI0024810E62|nr:hypothetical protein [Lysinibacillus sp. 1 U-2021]WGT37936.1 hypothetical protein QH639_19230 [Lysinibacillus sp. 1 U-2021]